jgi:hypothetical protein
MNIKEMNNKKGKGKKDKKYYSDNNKPNNEKHKVKKMTYLCTRIASILIAYCIVNFLND